MNDKLGVYRIGDLKFYSKLEAIEMHVKTGIHPHWDYNEQIFDLYDWTQEPSTPLPELYRQRAQQLRDNYDYLMLMYSGGSDSHNILKTFITNDIKLDEVVSFINFDGTGDRDSWFNEEIFRTAIPDLQHIQQTQQNIRHRVIDITQWEIEYFSTHQSRYEWIYLANFCFNPSVVAKGNWVRKLKDLSDLIDAGKRIAVISGVDKPRISQTDKGFCLRFLDMIDGSNEIPNPLRPEKDFTSEPFYWTPDLPELVIKQAHVVKNYMLSGDPKTLPYMTTEKSDVAFRVVDGKKYWLSCHGMSLLLYPHFQLGRIECGKGASVILSNRDSWFFDMEQENPIRKNWLVGLQKLWQFLPDYWKNDPTDISKGVKGCWSKDYYLEKL